jgi:hypothetical protein
MSAGSGPVAVMGTGMMASLGGVLFDGVSIDAAVGLALLVQFGGIVWWGSRMQTQQTADRELAQRERAAIVEQGKAARDEVRAERIATLARIHGDIGGLDTRLREIERHGSAEVQHLIKAVERLTEMSEETHRRLALVEGWCQANHGIRQPKGQPI